MSPAGRATKMPLALYPEVGPRRKRGLKSGRAGELSLSTPGLDLASKLRTFQRSLRGRVERRDALVDMVRAVNATLDPERVADSIIDRAAGWVPAPSWAVVSFDLSGQMTVLARRALGEAMTGAACRVASWVMDRGEEFTTADLAADARLQVETAGAAIALPLESRGRRVGALVALDRVAAAREPRLPATMLRAVRTLLEPAAVALDNALQLKRAEALSVTDELTGLYNSRYLNQSLRKEAKRATRSGRPLSLLFVDLDGFKGVNDTHGHLFGSRALVEAAAVIKGSARETDVVARFGGDEFALVLPDTGEAGALLVGARVRERIAAHTFLAAEGVNYRLTVSIGAATLPDAATTAETLLQAADTAMYAVKDAGKNGIRTATAAAKECL
jgi:diguanylate cyclase (GGDEF)-like protein